MRLPSGRRVRRGGRLSTAVAGRTSRRAASSREPLGPPGRWTLLAGEPGSGPWNMAIDMALARCAEPDRGILRIYCWDRPTMSFGRNQRAASRYPSGALEAAGLAAVRRPTGGREVVHDRELTYACVLPVASFGLRGTYARINGVLAEALRSLGLPAGLSREAGPIPSPDAGPCFGRAVAGEVEVEGRKIAGSAQVRVGRTILQHGSILLAPPRSTPPGFETAGVSAREILGRPVPFEHAARAVETAMQATFGGIWERGAVLSGTLSVARRLEREFASPDWTWRR